MTYFRGRQAAVERLQERVGEPERRLVVLRRLLTLGFVHVDADGRHRLALLEGLLLTVRVPDVGADLVEVRSHLVGLVDVVGLVQEPFEFAFFPFECRRRSSRSSYSLVKSLDVDVLALDVAQRGDGVPRAGEALGRDAKG